MSYLIGALPFSIYISRGLIYNSGNGLIHCKTKKKKLFSLRSHLFHALFALLVEFCWESRNTEGRRRKGRVGGRGVTGQWPEKDRSALELFGKGSLELFHFRLSETRHTRSHSKY